jgi:hypothetical protein
MSPTSFCEYNPYGRVPAGVRIAERYFVALEATATGLEKKSFKICQKWTAIFLLHSREQNDGGAETEIDREFSQFVKIELEMTLIGWGGKYGNGTGPDPNRVPSRMRTGGIVREAS